MGLILLSHSSQLYFKNPFCKPGWNCIDPQPLTLQNSIYEPTEPQNEVTRCYFFVFCSRNQLST